ncbi:hypothetical protein CQR47_1158 [Bifidobacterium thermophilum]|uniref:Uncharacterized protein n=1 Tax=Bifidobacterium thermophilum TaxID=33905 RepID=A0A2N3QK23_9BIFI|nr:MULTISPECIES: hypothetical protein [Bifidobacterium]MDC7285117.1 hypothetical protein [Bifidobacterium thermophilum]MDY5367534.1 hypothetical protein [Bifidobacterium sp.]NME61453.1 hypothetical protein [Bifidobacterium thermophilum]PKU91821.1 hypothetical protein CQR47_1158 [Bifidobacterium thermophilum]
MSREQDTVAPAIDRDTAATGRMRLRGVVDEAWRDIVSGTSHAFMLMLILAALVGGLSAADLFSIRSIAQQVDRYIASGASTYVIEFKGRISGEACERLSSVDGVLASGALRSKNDKVTSAVLPSASIPSLDATTGALGVFASSTRSGTVTLSTRDYDGIWLSSQAAQSVNASAGSKLALHAGGSVRIAGVFQYPDDGRSSNYQYVALSQVPVDANDFDQCVVKTWPVPDALQALLQSTVSSWPSDASQQPTISQLNATQGSKLDAVKAFRERQSALAPLVMLVIAFFIGFAVVRVRRLELASAMHCGEPKTALWLQMLLEALVWCCSAILVTLPLTIWAITHMDTGIIIASPTLVGILSRVPAAALAGVLAGVTLAMLVTRERDLFRYFKNR